MSNTIGQSIENIKINKSDRDILLDDFLKTRSESGDADLFAIEAAIFLEECLGIILKDEEIVAENLNAPESLKRFVQTRAVA